MGPLKGVRGCRACRALVIIGYLRVPSYGPLEGDPVYTPIKPRSPYIRTL